MDNENTEKLFKKYPEIFGQKDLPMNQTCMCWGIDTGNGWFWLIDQLCASIQQYVNARNEGIRIRNETQSETEIKESEWQVEAVQVKEKFGGLRFYINGADDMVYGMIHFAERLSYSICETCGTTENVKVGGDSWISTHGDGWIFTLCDKCRQEKRTIRKAFYQGTEGEEMK